MSILNNVFRKGKRISQPLPQDTGIKMNIIKNRISYMRQLAQKKEYKPYSNEIKKALDYCEEQLETITKLNPEMELKRIQALVIEVKDKLDTLDRDLANKVIQR
ncbi:MAG: hypothetical protein J5507_04700 [Clostridia bacterium]|nr:hypothetical protein [Clostridia bacterium]